MVVASDTAICVCQLMPFKTGQFMKFESTVQLNDLYCCLKKIETNM